MDARTRTASSIAQAKAELDRALVDLDEIPSFDPALIGVVAHALNNYITVTTATVDMLRMTLLDHPDRDVANWLDGIGHAANMMRHSIGRLVSVSAPRDFPLKLEYVNLPVLLERACEYYRRRADGQHLQITCQAVGPIPLVWGDRVALAVVADNLLSNAVRVSKIHDAVRVQIMAEPGHVVCSIRDAGPGLTAEEQARLFARPAEAAATRGADPKAGLGIAVAREFVDRMDGVLWCESTPGQGAWFSFRLPALV
jgi:signal transduction histidine kinase